MQKKTRVMITFTFIILLVSGLYVFTDWFSKFTGYFLGEEEVVKLAHCLDGKDAEFYSAVYCPDCEKTKKLFGQSFKLIGEVDCGNEKENCPNIQSVPAWFIDGKIHYGFKDINELKEISNC